MTVRRRRLAVLLAAAALTLTGCAGLPTGGPVFAGMPPGAVAPPDFSFVPLKPQDGASPEQIVQGFIDAGIGPEGNWAVAQMYLAPSFRDRWKPNAGTTIDDRTSRVYDTVGDRRVTLTVTQEATVDDTGAYKPSDGGPSTLSFSLAKVDGQWRITHAPDGIVLGMDQFTGVYHEYPLMYFDSQWRYLVPDVRWFPASNAATRIAKTLIDGKPSPWLAGSVVSAFPNDISLDPPSVPVTAGDAQVGLIGPVLSQQTQTMNRMQTQLLQSLSSAGATGLTMRYSGTALSAQTVPVAPTRVDQRALVRMRAGVGFLSATGGVDAVPGITDQLAHVDVASVGLAADYAAAVARTGAGAVLRVPAHGAVQTLDARSGLINPTLGSRGYVWSVPAAAPKALSAYGPDGKPVPLDVGGLAGASRITAMAMSRDGTRLAALLTVGGAQVVDVFGVVRAANGTPTGLGDAMQLAKLPGVGIDVTWLDDGTLGVLAHSGDAVVEIQQIVGGPGVVTPAPDGVTTISGTSGTLVRLLGADGTLYSQRGANWEQAGKGIEVLGTAQGMPE